MKEKGCFREELPILDVSMWLNDAGDPVRARLQLTHQCVRVHRFQKLQLIEKDRSSSSYITSSTSKVRGC